MKHSHEEHRDQHGNPKNKKAYLRRLLTPKRDAWQKPDIVLRVLGIKKGQTVAEIGAGPGYFTMHLARAVGKSGSVPAVEVDPELIGILRERLVKEGIICVTPIFGSAADPFLPPGSCDIILVVNVFHHINALPAYLRRLKKALKPGGRIVNIDFHNQDSPVGPPVGHRLAREDFLKSASGAGLKVVEEFDSLPYQYFLVLSKRK